MEFDLTALFLALLSLAIGSLGGYFLVKKTKIIDKFTEGSKERNKILNDPELLKEKILESANKLNPNAKGEIKILDRGEEIILEVKVKNGKKVLDFKRKNYVPKKEEMSPMQLKQYEEEELRKKEKDKAKKREEKKAKSKKKTPKKRGNKKK